MYELWYEDTSNIIDAYSAETEALTEVRAFIEDYGPSSVERNDGKGSHISEKRR